MPIYKINESSISNNSNLYPINEYFIGKNQYTEILKNDIHEIRDKTCLNKNGANRSPEVKKFASDIAQIFGFQKIQIIVDPSSTLNAATIYPISAQFDYRNMRKFIKTDKDRIYYDKSAKVKAIFLFYGGLMYSDKFTDDELLAVVLHEIGHNFQNAISPTAKGLIFARNCIQVIKIINDFCISVEMGITSLLYNNINPIMLKEKISNFISVLLDRMPNKVYELNYYIDKMDIHQENINYNEGAISAKLTSSLILQIISNKLTSYIGYRHEIIADSFATLFGYGAELSTALVKIDNIVDEILNKRSKANKYLNALSIPFEFIHSLSEPHPHTAIRLRKQMEYLEKELLNEDLDPDIKKEIHENMQAIKLQMDKILEKPDKSNKFYYNRLFKLMLTKFDKFTMRGGIFASGVDKEIDKIFNES